MAYSDADFDRFFKILSDAGSRTRSIIFAGSILTAAMMLVYVQTLYHDWAAERFKIIADAKNCVDAGDLPTTALPKQSFGLKTCGDAYKYVSEYYYIPLDKADIKKLKKEDGLIADLQERYDETLKGWAAETTMSVPFVGVTIDQNSMWLLSDFGGSVFLILLTLSLINEERVLISIYPLVRDHDLLRLILDSNVFSKPAFSRFLKLPVFWTFLYIPVVFSAFVLKDLYDGNSFVIILLRPNRLHILYWSERLALIGMFLLTTFCVARAWRVDLRLQELADKFAPRSIDNPPR